MNSHPVSLETLGWNSFFAAEFSKLEEPSLLPGRVVAEHKGCYSIATAEGEFLGEVSGKYFYQAQGRNDFPVAGDWVAVKRMPNADTVIIHHVLPRRSRFVRMSNLSRKDREAKQEEQIIASNIDTVFLMQGLDGNYNLRRIERFLVTLWDSGARPVIVLNKADACEDPLQKAAEVSAIAPGVPVHAISALTRYGLDAIMPYIKSGETVALIGSSGVGKSTLLNALLGKDVQKTVAVSLKDSKGRHTTAERHIFILENGGLLLDTPGMRGLQLSENVHGIEDVFDDIEKLAAGCRFIDCKHQNETGCAVQKAVAEGILEQKRLASFQKLNREIEYLESKHQRGARMKKKSREKILSREIKRYYKNGDKRSFE